MNDNEGSFRCITCGKHANRLFHNFNKKSVGNEVIRIEKCKECHCSVDRYIEYDSVLIFIDVLLHRHSAYCHILFNMKLQHLWRLLLIFLLCETYLKWDSHHRLHVENNAYEDNDHLFYAALEWLFYLMFLLSFIEWLVYSVVIYFLLNIRHNAFLKINRQKELWKGLSLSGFSKLMAIPAILWGQGDNSVFLYMAQLFFVTSNITGFRAVLGDWRPAIVIVLIAYGIQQLVSCVILKYIGYQL